MRRLLAALVALALGAWTHGGGGGDIPPNPIATLTILNTSGSTQAANFITPEFGMAFKEGDIPSGTAPQFWDALGNVLKFSWTCQSKTYASAKCAAWPDGSLKFSGFVLLDPDSIVGNGVQQIFVKTNGSGPSTSSVRTLTDVYNQSIITAATSEGTNFCRWSGNESAWVNGDTNTWKTTKYLDGDVGAGFEIWSHFAATVGGTADGQMEHTAYVLALTDNSGNLGGFRFLSRVHQPWYNPASPSTVNWCALSALTWQQNGNTAQSFIPSAASSIFSPINFSATSTSSTTFTTASANPFNQGGPEGNVYPVVLSNAGGSLPGNLTSTQLYWLRSLSPSTTNINFSASSAWGGPIKPSSLGSGTNTITPVLAILYYGGLFNATSKGTYNYFQGTGSIATDSTVIVQYDPVYTRSTGMIPPYGNVTGVGDNVFSKSSTGWQNIYFPGAQGVLYIDLETSGARDDLGPENGWYARDYFNQSADDDTMMRILGLAESNWPYDIRDITTGNLITIRPTTGGGNYTGMPASNNTAAWFPGNSAANSGIANPPNSNQGYGFQTFDGSHAPELAYYAELKTGEQQYLDLLQERSVGLSMNSTGSTRNITSPYTDYDVIASKPTQMRLVAWTLRDKELACAASPAASPDSSQTSTYLCDLANSDSKYMDYVMVHSTLGSYPSSVGLWAPGNTTNVNSASGGFQSSYTEMAASYGAAAASDANLLDLVKNYFAVWDIHVLSQFQGYVAYTDWTKPCTGQSGTGSFACVALNTADNQYGIEVNAVASDSEIHWGNSSPAFSISVKNGYVPTAGDIINFSSGLSGSIGNHAPPGGFSSDTIYYATNVSGPVGGVYTFDLSATCATSASNPTGCSNGSTALVPSDTGAMSCGTGPVGPFVLPSNPPSAASGSTPSGGTTQSYAITSQGAARWMTAVGATGLGNNATGFIGDATTRLTVQGVNNAIIATDPIFSMQQCFSGAC